MEQSRNKALEKAVDFILTTPGVDICQICIFYNEQEQSERSEKFPNYEEAWCVTAHQHGEDYGGKICKCGIMKNFEK